MAAAAFKPADTDPMGVWVAWDSGQRTTKPQIGIYKIEVSSGLDSSGLYAPRIRLSDAISTTTDVAGAGLVGAPGSVVIT